MKKKIISVILIVVTTALLSGCGSSQKERAHYRIKAEYYDSGIFNVNEEIAVAFDGGEPLSLQKARKKESSVKIITEEVKIGK